MPLPDPDTLYPISLPDGSPHRGTVNLRQALDHPRISAGAYSYASDLDPPEDWAARLAPYLYPFSQERLTIGRFCQIAHGVRFLTSSANHARDGLTCYPFAVFDPDRMSDYQPDTRDTVIGNDVWIGYGATVLPGAHIGNGAILGAKSVVGGTVPDYAVVTGNPGRVAKFRFSEPDIGRLLALSWWDWPREAIIAALPALEAGDIDQLENLAPAAGN